MTQEIAPSIDGADHASRLAAHAADIEALLAQEGTVLKGIKNAAFDPANLVAQGASLGVKVALGATVNPAAAVGVVSGAGAEAWDRLERGLLGRAGLQLDTPSQVLAEQMKPLIRARIETFFNEVANDPNITTREDLDNAVTQLQAGFDMANKGWPPPRWKYLLLRKKLSNTYFDMGFAHAEEIASTNKKSRYWKGVSKILFDVRKKAIEVGRAELATAMFGAAPGTTQLTTTPEATPNGSSGSATTTTPLAVATSSTSSSTTGSGGIGDVRAVVTQCVESLRMATRLTAQAHQALSEANQQFIAGSDGSTEQAPKDVITAYDAANTSLSTAAPALTSAERNILDWLLTL